MSFLSQISSIYIPAIHISDCVEILILFFLVYKLITELKNTRAMIILKGVLILFVFYNIAYLCSFEAILVLFQGAIALFVFAIIVVFQPEMRKFLENIGTQSLRGQLSLFGLFKQKHTTLQYYTDTTISEIVKGCFAMGSVKTGALIVLERKIPLGEYIKTGIYLNADITSSLLINIFEKNTPLHDGAIVVVGNKIVSGTCYLPLSDNTRISKHMGTRHRAAIGASEVTDCVVIVVSEETGAVSLVEGGKIHFKLDEGTLSSLLSKYQSAEQELSVVKSTTYFNRERIQNLIVSGIVTIAGWVLLMNVANPLTTVKIENVPIEVINTSVVEALGKTYEITSDSFVDVLVQDKRSVVDNLSAEDITVKADLSKLSIVNAVQLEVSVPKIQTAKASIDGNNTISVFLDSIISKEVNVLTSTVGSTMSNYFVSAVEPNVSKIVLTGAKSKLDTVDFVECIFDISDATDTYIGYAQPIIYDKNGDILDSKNFKLSLETIKGVGKVYPIIEVPLTLNVLDDNLTGYDVEDITYEPKTIRIAGEQQTLKKIKSVSVDMSLALDFTTATNNTFLKTVKLSEHLPKGVYLVDDVDEVVATVTFLARNTKTLTFNKDQIEIRGVLVDEQVTVEDSEFEITVSGEDSVLSALTTQTVRPYLDVSDLPIGTYNMIIQFVGIDNVTLISNVSVKLSIEPKK